MSQRHFLTLATLTALIFTVTPIASAQLRFRPNNQNGVVLISQSTIGRGLGCPAQVRGSFPILICAPGSYQLTSSLHVSPGLSGILIEAPNVTLNLNGFTISTSGAPTGGVSGVEVRNPFSGLGEPGCTIENGSIDGFLDKPDSSSQATFGAGVRANGIGGVIRNLFLTHDGHALMLLNTWSVTGNTIVGNGSGIWAHFATYVALLNNFVSQSSADAVDAPLFGTLSYGHNTFLGNAPDTPSGNAVSMGDNVCGSSRC